MSDPVKYKRVLLKISGEGLCQPGGFGIDGDVLQTMAEEIIEACKSGTEIAVVVGGGNIVRGGTLAQEGRIPRASADYMGMLGTVINAIALKEMLEKLGQKARVLSAINLTSVAEPFIRGRAIRHLEKGRVVILAAGTGNPFFTTDTCASLRAVEIGAEVVLKATKVDGIYDKDPHKYDDAVRYETLTYKEAIDQKLGVMDMGAFTMCMEHKLPILVFRMKDRGNIKRAVSGEQIGTLVSE